MDIKQLSFNVGDRISVNDVQYKVNGKIVFEDKNDVNYTWTEYYLTDSHHINQWLSIDKTDIILWSISKPFNAKDYALVEKDTEVVRSAYGKVDVENGDIASYEEFEDFTTDSCYCIENWDDGTEYSMGQRVKEKNIYLIQQTTEMVKENTQSNSSKIWLLFGAIAFLVFLISSKNCSNSYEYPTVHESLKWDANRYSYKTSITGQHNMFADIYSTSFPTDSTTFNIIDKIEGNVVCIHENQHDSNVVAFLTPDEICLIYKSVADSSTLIHVASRKWTIMNLDQPLYQADSLTEDFYRSFYDYNAFATDSAEYSDDELNTHYQSSGHRSTYDTYYHNHISGYYYYASSVRQSAISRRGSSGGGSGGGGK